jgi:thiamine pyrophosphokinase
MTDIHIILGAPKDDLLQPLLKSDGFVIGVDRGALLAIEEGISVDVALGDFDSISAYEKNIIAHETKELIEYPSEKDGTDAEMAILYVLEHYEEANVFIYNWYGGRIDHLYSILLLAHQERFEKLIPNLRLVSKNNDISYFLPGEHAVEKIAGMDYLSYILLTEVKDLTLEDVKYPLTNESFKRPLALISNEFLGEKAFFSFNEGLVAVVQSRD